MNGPLPRSTTGAIPLREVFLRDAVSGRLDVEDIREFVRAERIAAEKIVFFFHDPGCKPEMERILAEKKVDLLAASDLYKL